MHRRVFTVSLPLFGTLAVATAVATWLAQLRARVIDAELSLADTGTGTGNTTVDVKLNGTTILAAGALSLAGAGATKAIRATPVGVVGEPSGVEVAPNDSITVDVTAIPATTAPKGGFVTLTCVAKDV